MIARGHHRTSRGRRCTRPKVEKHRTITDRRTLSCLETQFCFICKRYVCINRSKAKPCLIRKVYGSYRSDLRTLRAREKKKRKKIARDWRTQECEPGLNVPQSPLLACPDFLFSLSFSLSLSLPRRISREHSHLSRRYV